ncbi:hypothetical protein SU69_07245 [Thermosipho melanesiensis]|uniref:Uncharacterized protein n=2 Tax=Thermosipho melanesiensis TaxID=46541 RepID=A6LMX6_THEM4|nr:hypothetical protein [Thermosipho melanesiensis]ABR31277.1 hypothetical protein Tmel_1430 [Thermosipho melanesiensis BI429]APT74357.1 hypothetical protein BW47_07570 [Thermosipho melanesiensis]OOC36300.1 hypothetical protein SU68_07315 [Thermosipho melanesiensis]OOC37118.1 hypothetical protein SU69_07245 [Thermosipho melanesiensis]OOC37870.1 hypothetical protein SU70_07255 [Thermosipho melanesiensis]
MEPIELHPIYLRSSVEKSTQFSNLQNYTNIAAEISAQQLNERIKKERTSPKNIEKTPNKNVRSSTDEGNKNKRDFYNKKGRKNENKIVEAENSHILDVRI